MAGNYLNGVEQHDAYGRVIREARKKKGLTQEELGDLIDVSARTIGEWERDEGSPTPIHKQALVECLGIEPALIGAERQRDFSPQEASEYRKRITSYLDRAMFNSAFTGSEFLARNLKRQIKQKRGDEALVKPLIHATYLAGHAASIARNDPELASDYYEGMQHYALRLNETDPERQTLLSLALTYQGEMLRRRGKLENALQVFKQAPQTPQVDPQVRGNRAQLLARVYTDLRDEEEAMRQLDRSLDLLSEKREVDSGFYLCYNQCGTYIEYSRFYRIIGNIQQSLKSIEQAEREARQAPQRWRIPVLINKAKLLLHKAPGTWSRDGFSMGEDFAEGMRLLEEAIDLAHKADHRRQITKIEAIGNSLLHQGKEYIDAGCHLLGKSKGFDQLTRTIVD